MIKKKQGSLSDYIFIAIGLCTSIAVFYLFPQIHPLQLAPSGLTEEVVKFRADSLFNRLQLNLGEGKSVVALRSRSGLLDSLQAENGRNEFLRLEHSIPMHKRFPLYYWDYEWIEKRDIIPNTEALTNSRLSVQFSRDGSLLQLSLPESKLNGVEVNMDAIRFAFSDSIWFRIPEDSLVTGLLQYQTPREPGQQSNIRTAEQQLFRLAGGTELRRAIVKLAEYQIQQSFWERYNPQVLSSRLEEIGSMRVEKVDFALRDPNYNLPVHLEVMVSPTGALLGLKQIIPTGLGYSTSYSVVRGVLFVSVLFIFTIWMLVMFYLRLRARLIDLKSSLVIALMAGLALSAYVFIQNYSLSDFNIMENGIVSVLNNFLSIGASGAFSSIVFFILSALSDSISRQFWSDKISTFDLFRNLILNNAAMGWVGIRGISAGFIASGIMVAVLWMFPSITISHYTLQIAPYAFLGPIATLLLELLLGFAIISIVFQLAGIQIFAVTNQKNYLLPVGFLMFFLINPLVFGLDQTIGGSLLSGLIGLYLSLLYLRWDFLTVLLSYLSFSIFSTAVIAISSGIPGSIFSIALLFLLGGIFILSIVAISKGKPTPKTLEYVPEYISELAKEERVKQELEIARDVQISFLPRFVPQMKGYSLDGICTPAMETGGDYFDAIKLDEHRLAVTIGDVSGKGVRAAFYMTFAKGVIHSLSESISDPAYLLTRLNKLFNDSATRGTFISMIYGILDIQSNTFTFARAGHNPLLIRRHNGETEWLQPRGIGIGMAKGAVFAAEVENYVLKMDDISEIIFHTDGISECLNEDGEFFGEARIAEILKQCEKKSANFILNKIIAEVHKFKGAATQHDDLTLLVLSSSPIRL